MTQVAQLCEQIKQLKQQLAEARHNAHLHADDARRHASRLDRIIQTMKHDPHIPAELHNYIVEKIINPIRNRNES